MAASRGKLIYNIYRALSYGISPFLYFHLRWRRHRGLEHPLRWTERLGRSSLPRPSGPLLWFHAVSLGEGMAAIAVIKECIRRRPDLNILMTTTTVSAFKVIKNRLPTEVIYQFAPLDTPAAMDAFFGHWKPNVIVIMESELWPNLIMDASRKGSTLQAIHFQLLHAPPSVINFSGDLKFAVEEFDTSDGLMRKMEDLKAQLSGRKVWMASSIHKGEEEAQKLQKEGEVVALRSQHDKLGLQTNIYVVDTLGELRLLYELTPIAVIGGSFLPGLGGHNISEAAAVGCAVITGPHVGHFSKMVLEMQQLNPLSVMQVPGKLELEESLKELFRDAKVLEAHRMAAKRTFQALSHGIVANVWNVLNYRILRPILSSNLNEDQFRRNPL